MTNWKLHKKLIDAGGLGPAVYICSARANGKLATQRMIESELRASGRTVVYVRPQEPKKLLGARKSWVVMDRDVLTPEHYERAERIWNEYWKGERKRDR